MKKKLIIIGVVLWVAIGVFYYVMAVRLGGRGSAPAGDGDGAMMKVVIGYEANESGYPADMDAVFALIGEVEEALDAALRAADAGFVDGNEYGLGRA